MKQFDDHYENLTTPTLCLIVVLAIFVVLSEVGLWSTFQEIEVLQSALRNGWVAQQTVSEDGQRQALVAGLQLLSFVAAAGLFLYWIHAASRNARSLGAAGMRYGPKSAVAWWFVPLLNLWKPFEVLRELFIASHPDHLDDWKRAPEPPRLLSLHWTLWLLFQFTVVLSLVSDLLAPTLDRLMLSAWLALVVGTVAPPLGVATCIIAWRLRALQHRRYRNVAPLRVRQPWPTRSGGASHPAS